jgi:RNA polymerase sigma factor (sigma-70 family)
MLGSVEVRAERLGRDRSRVPVLEALYYEHAPSLRAWLAARVHRSHVDDVSQEIWVKVLGAYGTRFDGSSFRSWLFTIAKNCLIDRARKKREQPCDLGVAPPTDPKGGTPLEGVVDEEMRRNLAACMAALGHPRRTIVVERLSGAEYDDLSSALGLTKQQAFQHFFAAKKLLRACMKEKYPEISA